MHFASVELPVPEVGWPLKVNRYGHWGRPVLAFPAEGGGADQLADMGLVDAVRPLIDAGAISVFTVSTLDGWTWSDRGLPTEERAARHRLYHRWLEEQVVPWIFHEVGGHRDMVTTGVSLGAYHAVQFTLRRADVAPAALGLSGSYDVRSWNGWGDLGDATFWANPTQWVPALHGDHLNWLRSRVRLSLVVGQGAFEWHPTRSLPSTRELAHLAGEKGLWCELHEWGADSAHDWPWWHRQIAHHLPALL